MLGRSFLKDLKRGLDFLKSDISMTEFMTSYSNLVQRLNTRPKMAKAYNRASMFVCLLLSHLAVIFVWFECGNFTVKNPVIWLFFGELLEISTHFWEKSLIALKFGQNFQQWECEQQLRGNFRRLNFLPCVKKSLRFPGKGNFRSSFNALRNFSHLMDGNKFQQRQFSFGTFIWFSFMKQVMLYLFV